MHGDWMDLGEAVTFQDFSKVSDALAKKSTWAKVEGEVLEKLWEEMDELALTVNLDDNTVASRFSPHWIHMLMKYIEWQLLDAATTKYPYLDNIRQLRLNLKESKDKKNCFAVGPKEQVPSFYNLPKACLPFTGLVSCSRVNPCTQIGAIKVVSSLKDIEYHIPIYLSASQATDPLSQRCCLAWALPVAKDAKDASYEIDSDPVKLVLPASLAMTAEPQTMTILLKYCHPKADIPNCNNKEGVPGFLATRPTFEDEVLKPPGKSHGKNLASLTEDLRKQSLDQATCCRSEVAKAALRAFRGCTWGGGRGGSSHGGGHGIPKPEKSDRWSDGKMRVPSFAFFSGA
jgi:hypothetical protein